MTDLAVAPLPISEAQLQDAIVDLARLRGWKVAHFAPARTDKGHRTPCRYDAEGWPDLVICREPTSVYRPGIYIVPCNEVLYWEVKSEKGKVSAAQQAWLDVLGGRVIRPSDWIDGTVERLLE